MEKIGLDLTKETEEALIIITKDYLKPLLSECSFSYIKEVKEYKDLEKGISNAILNEIILDILDKKIKELEGDTAG